MSEFEIKGTVYLDKKLFLEATIWRGFFMHENRRPVCVTRQNMFDLKNKLNFNLILPSNTDATPTQKQNQHFDLKPRIWL